MRRFLSPPLYKPEQTGPEADHRYRKLRLQVFIGAFIGYAAFYICLLYTSPSPRD